ncbi:MULTISPECIES: TRAP transporter large permease [Acetomicrobium]|jgi:tripartite ATP-independent transporter DctM subunit|uniref:TRAP transporter large permease n=1 Tax=Acetomicrobium TaxID=49894 RepID=UPI0016B13F10|nr:MULTISPECIES: TRAP transporter large permease [Acetomicrobium]MDR9769344.1 TRAP transporter large permease [Acetomicrobium sp.]NLI43768.1 TRAP transporter large permease [Synergistaceae bacterium]
MLGTTIATWILLGSFAIMLILRIPITFALAASSIFTAMYLKIPLMVIIQQMVQGVNSFSLMAIPFFIIAGEIMGEGGISQRLIEFANVIVGRFRGGLALVNVLASTFFGGISGSAVADVSSIGAILIPMMKKQGYDTDYSVAVTVTSACQGIIIPPSHNMIIYSLAAGGVSVGRLFLGGFIPGITLGIALMIVSYIMAVKRNYPTERSYSFKEALFITKDALFGIFTAVIILGGVISGIFTATESAAIACVYAFIITFFVYREIPLSRMNKILYSSLRTLAMVMSLIAAAKAFGWLLAYLRIPALVTTSLLNITTNPILLLLLINGLLILLGCIMDMAPLILITTPILYPIVVNNLGMDPVQFGIMMMLNLGIGLCTPPVGSALFVGCAIGKISIEKATVAMLPFYLAMIVVLLLVTFIPIITLFIPNLLMG